MCMCKSQIKYSHFFHIFKSDTRCMNICFNICMMEMENKDFFHENKRKNKEILTFISHRRNILLEKKQHISKIDVFKMNKKINKASILLSIS